MKSTWILVADNSQARLFTVETATSGLLELDTLQHPEGRLHEQELDSDLPGKNTSTAGGGGHAYQNKIGPKEQESINFAKKIARYLDSAHNANKFEHLLIVAAPSFLGTLRKQFSDSLHKAIVFSLDKDLKGHTLDDIRAHLPMPLFQIG